MLRGVIKGLHVGQASLSFSVAFSPQPKAEFLITEWHYVSLGNKSLHRI